MIRHQVQAWALRQGPKVGVLSQGSARSVGRLSASAFLRWTRRRERRAMMHLSRAFPDWPRARLQATVRTSAGNAGACWAEATRLAHLSPLDRMATVDISALEGPVRAGLQAGTGAIVVTGWIGHWEGLAAALAGATGEVMLVTRRLGSVEVHDAAERLRRRWEVRTSSFSSARIDALRWLRLNRVVVVVADGDAGRDGAFMPLFGRTASINPLAPRLAADTGAPCMASFCLPEGSSWRATMESLPVGRWAPREVQRDVQVRWVALFEEMALKHPEWTFWHPRRWKTRPSPEEKEMLRNLDIPIVLPQENIL